MNYDPVSREVIGSVDHSPDGVPTVPYAGCCGDVETQRVTHADDCHCFGNEHRHIPWPPVATVPDVEGKDVNGAIPQEVAQIGSKRYRQGKPDVVHTAAYPVPGHYDAPNKPEYVTDRDVEFRISERTMWATERIAKALETLVQLYVDDANG